MCISYVSRQAIAVVENPFLHPVFVSLTNGLASATRDLSSFALSVALPLSLSLFLFSLKEKIINVAKIVVIFSLNYIFSLFPQKSSNNYVRT